MNESISKWLETHFSRKRYFRDENANGFVCERVKHIPKSQFVPKFRCPTRVSMSVTWALLWSIWGTVSLTLMLGAAL